MPVTFSKMAANEATITMTGGPLGDDSLTLTYYPNKLTKKTITQLDNGLDGLNQTLSDLIKVWDVLDEDDAMYPLNPDSLAALGIPVLIYISRAIVEDIRPN